MQYSWQFHTTTKNTVVLRLWYYKCSTYIYIYNTAALRCAQPTTVAPAALYSRQGIHIHCAIYLHTSPNLLCGRVLWKFPAKSSTFSSSPFEMWHVGPTSNSSLAMASRLSRVTFARSFGCERGGFSHPNHRPYSWAASQCYYYSTIPGAYIWHLTTVCSAYINHTIHMYLVYRDWYTSRVVHRRFFLWVADNNTSWAVR